jgi:hypothetical protein
MPGLGSDSRFLRRLGFFPFLPVKEKEAKRKRRIPSILHGVQPADAAGASCRHAALLGLPTSLILAASTG